MKEMSWEAFERQFPVQLNEQQKQAVKSVDGPILLLAVPGSGKTTVLVTRLGYMIFCKGIAPEKILTVTYTVAATKDMSRRFASYFGEELAERLEFRTINGICAKIIQYYSRSVGKSAFELVQDEKIILHFLIEIYQETEHSYPTESDLKNVRTLITYIKNMMLTEEEIRHLEEKEELKLLEIYQAYCVKMRKEGLMDYDDQMVYAYNMLRKFPDLLAYFQRLYPYICVDEAQDTSRIQHAIIKLLASGTEQLFMVGDEDQSIYGFRAAYPKALLSFEKDHPRAKVLLMEENFRSNAKIVEAADRFIQENQFRHEKHMRASKKAEREIREIALKSRRAQYQYLLKVAKRCEIQTAVLYRDHECAIPLIDLLERQEIPYRMRNAEVTFFTNRVVLDIVHIIQFAANPSDEELFLQIYYKLRLYLSRKEALEIIEISRERDLPILDAALLSPKLDDYKKSNAKAMRTHLKHLLQEPGDKAVNRITNYMGYQDYLQRNEINDSKLEVVKIIGKLEPTAEELIQRLDELKEIIQTKKTSEDCPFILSTIHASKGLEYEIVYMLDVVDGILPAQIPRSLHSSKPSREEMETYEEERRLFYVGATRAKQDLRLMTTNRKSSFCEELLGKREKTNTRSGKKESVYSSLSNSATGNRKNGNRSNNSRAGRNGEPTGYKKDGVYLTYASHAAKKDSATGTQHKIEKIHPGITVVHRKFGTGTVITVDEKNVQIRFKDKIRKLNLAVVASGGWLQL